MNTSRADRASAMRARARPPRAAAWAVAAALFAATAHAHADPITLDAALAAALRHHPSVAAAAARAAAATARIDVAGQRPPPTLTASVENFAGTGDAHGFALTEWTLAYGASIEAPGKRAARIDIATAERALTAADAAIDGANVAAEVRARFADALEAQALLDAAGDAEALARTGLQAAQRRVQAGRAPRVEAERSEAALDIARLERRQALTARDTRLAQLALMWGSEAAALDGLPVTGVDADPLALPEVTPLAALRARLATSADARRLDAEARARDADIALARAQRGRDIDWSVGVRHLDDGDADALIASVSVPLFVERRASAGIDEARHRREALEFDQRRAALDASARLAAAHGALVQRIDEARALRDDVLPRLDAVLRGTQYAYERGRYGLPELVGARRELLDARRALVRAAADARRLADQITRITTPADSAGGAQE